MFCLLRLCKSWLHAAQGMEFVARSRRLVRGHRGLRPRSVQWPHQQKGKGKGVAPSAAPRGLWRNPDRGTRAPAQIRRDQPTRLSPEEVVTAAQERVQKLERALEVSGEDSGPEFQVLQNFLKKVKFQLGSSWNSL